MENHSGEENEETPLLEERSDGCMKTRHLFAFMGFLGFANVYAMRVNLSVAIVAMVNSTTTNGGGGNSSAANMTDTCPLPANSTDSGDSPGPFNWDEKEQGMILGSFFYGYVLTQIPGGRLAEVWGGKWLYGIGVLVTAVLTLLTPLAANAGVGVFTAVRVLEGLGEGVTFPAMHAMLSKWSPPNERSKMGAQVYSGSQFGTVLSLPISGWLADQYGWESVFYVFGVIGTIWFIAWVFLVTDDPQNHLTISRQEQEFIRKSIGPSLSGTSPKVPWMSILGSIPVWALVIVHMAQNWGFYTLLTELPTYMKNILHFDIKKNSFISALPYLLMWLIALGIGPVADSLIDRNILSRNVVRKSFNTLALCLPALFLILAGYSGCDVTATVIFLSLAGGTNGAHYSGFMSTHIDMSPNYAGTLLGITNGFANIMGFLAPTFTGYIINQHQDLHHWRFVFFVAAIIYVFGNTVFVLLGSTKEQKWNNENLESNDRAAEYQQIASLESEEYLSD